MRSGCRRQIHDRMDVTAAVILQDRVRSRNWLKTRSWSMTGISPKKGKSGDLVTWELLRIGERTRVNLRHSGFDPARYNKDYMQGWHAYLLTLKDYLRVGRTAIIRGD